jgi:hypothetical protein
MEDHFENTKTNEQPVGKETACDAENDLHAGQPESRNYDRQAADRALGDAADLNIQI